MKMQSKEVECTTSNGSGVGQKQMEASSSSLIIIEMTEESRRKERGLYKEDETTFKTEEKHPIGLLYDTTCTENSV